MVFPCRVVCCSSALTKLCLSQLSDSAMGPCVPSHGAALELIYIHIICGVS